MFLALPCSRLSQRSVRRHSQSTAVATFTRTHALFCDPYRAPVHLRYQPKSTPPPDNVLPGSGPRLFGGRKLTKSTGIHQPVARNMHTRGRDACDSGAQTSCISLSGCPPIHNGTHRTVTFSGVDRLFHPCHRCCTFVCRHGRCLLPPVQESLVAFELELLHLVHVKHHQAERVQHRVLFDKGL